MSEQIDLLPYQTALKGQKLPLAFVDMDAFERNIKRAKDAVKNAVKSAQTPKQGRPPVKIRIATKSLRVPGLLQRVLESDPIFQGLMCYSAQEAKELAAQGFDDFLIAYPSFQQSDLLAVKELHLLNKRVRLMVDSLEGIKRVSAFMGELAQPLPLCLEVDLSLRLLGVLHLGVRRSPVKNFKQVLGIFTEALSLKNIRLDALMGYEAQVAGLGDKNPFKKLLNPVAKMIRSVSMSRIVKKRAELKQKLLDHGFTLTLFNGGGTGNLNWAAKEECLTEVTMGSGLLCSHLFDYYSNIYFEPAAFFALQVVRSSDQGYVTCQGGGYIASGEPGWDRVPVPIGPGQLKLVSTEGCGEVQTPVQILDGTSLTPGDLIFFRHAKAGELAERFNEYVVVSRGRILGHMPTYRGLGFNFF